MRLMLGILEALRRELMLHGVDAILIEPGYVNTPILDKAEAGDFGLYRDTDYAARLERFVRYFIGEGRKGLPPQAIGEAVYTALTMRKPPVSYTAVQGEVQELDGALVSAQTAARPSHRQATRPAAPAGLKRKCAGYNSCRTSDIRCLLKAILSVD